MTSDWDLRLTSIENLMKALTERQVHQQVETSQLQQAQKEIQQSQKELQESQKRTDLQIQAVDRQIEAVVALTARTADAQERTESRLQSLIETVDRIIRNR